MIDYLSHPLFIAGLGAFLLMGSELALGKYAVNFGLLMRQPFTPIIYALYYALLAIGITQLLLRGNLSIHEFSAQEHPLVIGLITGLSIRALARMNLYQFKIEGKTINIGPKTINDFMEGFFLKKISDNVDGLLIGEINAMIGKLPPLTLEEIDLLLRDGLPSHFSQEKRKYYVDKIKACPRPFDKYRYFAFHFGLQRLHQLPLLAQNFIHNPEAS
ncbi:hypothetical protein [Persicobacter sp. CCB-QB2]|uniref:hypothetical protein n=1 Tax=Persicobacter sp. CCB-QB2 TaxID=1561025 RepID=UPI0006A9A7C9|nr:hypothetical protein [Persicobacter sp. CCB-QB2]